MATTDRAAAERGAGEWDPAGSSPPAVISTPESGRPAGGRHRADVPTPEPPAPAGPVAAPTAPPGPVAAPTAPPPPPPYPAQVYGAPPPPAPAPPASGLPVGLPAGTPVPARNPYAPPPRGGPAPTAYRSPGATSATPRADPGARYPDAAAAPTVPHSYAEEYGYGYETEAPPWAGGPAARPAGSGRSIAAFVLAAIALFVLPPFVGAAAIVLAAFAIRRGERLGRAALVTALLGTAGGVTLGVLSYTAGIPGF